MVSQLFTGMSSMRTLLWEQELVDDNVMRINLVRCELLHEALRLVQRQELRNTYTDECRLLGILEFRYRLTRPQIDRFHR